MGGLVAIVPFYLNLTHVLTIVCGFPNPSAPINTVTEYGITTFDEFRLTEYDIAWTHTVNNATIAVTGSKAVILSASIAWARDLETKQLTDMNTPQNWTKDDFMKWRRNEYSIWKNSIAAAAASGTAVTGATTAAGDDQNKLTDFNKTSKSEKDYEILKNDKYFFGWKKKFERKSQLHKYKRLLESMFDDTETHRLTLTIGSHDLELFDDQVNFLSII